jgi:hypothetical protein
MPDAAPVSLGVPLGEGRAFVHKTEIEPQSPLIRFTYRVIAAAVNPRKTPAFG